MFDENNLVTNLEIFDLKKSYMQRRWQIIIRISRCNWITIISDYLSSNNSFGKENRFIAFKYWDLYFRYIFAEF